MPTILAAEDDVSREQTQKTPAVANDLAAAKRIPNGFQTDDRQQNPQKPAQLTHLTDTREGAQRDGMAALRQTIAAIEAGQTRASLAARAHVRTGVAEVDETLGGGLLRGTIHELLPKAAPDIPAAAGFAVALAVRAQRPSAHTLYIQHDFTRSEAGRPYLPGLHLLGLDAAALIYLHVPRAEDVVWAMGEALKCRGFAAVIAEFPSATRVLDLTMTRRLALAAQDGMGLGLLLRHAGGIEPNAAATRWLVSATPAASDMFGGLGAPAFHLDLVKNRFGRTGQWRVEWQSYERTFAVPSFSRGLARPSADRPPRTHPLAQTA